MAAILENLRLALTDGLSIVSRIWDFKASNWVTCIYAADIDGDGDVEILVGSRDGRVYCLSKTGKLRWRRAIGTRAWIVTLVGSGPAIPGKEVQVRIIAGTRDGKVYMLDSAGRMITRDGRQLYFNDEGEPLEPEQALKAYWFSVEHVIRSIYIDPSGPSQIIIGTEDRCAYGLDFKTGEQLWSYATGGWVRTVFACDINEDGRDEVILGSSDGSLYVCDQCGQTLLQYALGHPIRTIFVEDVDQDGCMEILAATNHKSLVALAFREGRFEKKWERGPFANRLLTLYVTDIDGDGQKEIISSCDDKRIYILDANGNTLWRHNHKNRIFDIATPDIDNDGLPELLIGGENKRVRAMHVRLRRGVEERIRRYYQRLRRVDRLTLPGLNVDERGLLQDILGPDRRKLVAFEQARERIKAGACVEALSILLTLQQQKVERLWYNDDIEYIRTVCLRHTTQKLGQEIIIGTAGGDIYAFHANGRCSWYKSLDDHIVDVQTGFIDHYRREEIVICSSDHHLYMLGGEKDPLLHEVHIPDAFMSSICVKAARRQESPEIIIGTEDKKLSIYHKDLHKREAEIPTEEGVRIVRAHTPGEEDTPEIVVAGLKNCVYAYKRNGKRLWSYPTYDHIKSVCIKDINGDGQAEVLVGSEDRNIHALDSAGRLLWRYYLPHSVLTIDAADADQDGMVEIFVGCADGYLYVFNRDGDLLWTYQAKDRIHAVRIDDIDGDGNYEIAIGAEDEFELLRIVNQQHVANAITQCWTELLRTCSSRDAIARLLQSQAPLLQAFALNRLVEEGNLRPGDFDTLEKYAAEGAPEARKQIAHLIAACYPLDPARAGALLRQLWSDLDFEVRNVIIERLPALMKYDWEAGFYYLKHATGNPSRFVRRIAVRKVDELIKTSAEPLVDRERRHQIFALLLVAAQDKASEWVRQEAAHALAHYLDQHQGSFIVYVHLFIVKHIHRHVWEQIEHVTNSAFIRRYISALLPLLYNLNAHNVQENLQQMLQAQSGSANFLYGKDALLIYDALHHLFTLETLEEIAGYRCDLREDQFLPRNQYARHVLPVFRELGDISRPLKLYFRREDLQDQLNSLLEAIDVTNRVRDFLEQQYAIVLLGEPMNRLPDYRIFLLLLNKWKALMQSQLNELRGKAELIVTLLTRDIRKEEQVGIWLAIKNVGRSSANNVKITLLHSDHFAVVGDRSFETEVIAAGEETTAEFILRPCGEPLHLKFEIVYDDMDTSKEPVREIFEDCVEFRNWCQEYRRTPNLYSTGTPTHNSEMFYGREEDIAFLKDNLTREVKGVVVLYGQRRSGKTSLLLQLITASALGEHIPVLLDMQGVSYNVTIESFLRRVAHHIEQAMRRKGITITAPRAWAFKLDAINAFDIFLDHVEKRLAGRKLILLIDEFEVLEEQVIKGQLKPEIFEYLRDIVQHRQAINFLFSGTHRITEYTRWYRSIFFNIATHHRLSRLPPHSAEDLIQKPVAGYLEYEPLTVQKIRLLTADQPYLIHLMCRAIVDYCNARRKNYVTINDVNIVLQEVMETGHNHFDWLWDQIKPEERVALAAIAECSKEEGRWLPLAEIEEVYSRFHIPYRKDYFLETLKTLVEADIVEFEQEDSRKSRFRIAVGLTRTWILREHRLDTVRKEMNG